MNLLSSERTRLTAHGALRVPEITAWFWIIKGLSTALGESTSDYLVHAMPPVLAVLLGFAGFVAALSLQFRMRRYTAVAYWLAVVMVGVSARWPRTCCTSASACPTSCPRCCTRWPSPRCS